VEHQDSQARRIYADRLAAQDLLFWAIGAVQARRESLQRSDSVSGKPCTALDIILHLDRLRSRGRLTRIHDQLLARYGARFVSPDRHHPAERAHAEAWDHMLDLLALSLRQRGIIGREALAA